MLFRKALADELCGKPFGLRLPGTQGGRMSSQQISAELEAQALDRVWKAFLAPRGATVGATSGRPSWAACRSQTPGDGVATRTGRKRDDAQMMPNDTQIC
jgi:hypothetical protein